jgi:CRISPR-associated endonuclease Csn1
MVADEFEALWDAQRPHHPGILTDELRRKLEDIAFSQRPTFFRRGTIGQCELEPGAERAFKAEWLT